MHCQQGGQGWAAPKLWAMGWGSPWPRALSGEQPNAWAALSFCEQINDQVGRTRHLNWKLLRAEGGHLLGLS